MGNERLIQSQLENKILFIWNMERRQSDAQYLAGKVDGYLDAIAMIAKETNSQIIAHLREQS